MSLATEIYERLIPKTPARTDSYILGLQRTMLDATPDCIKLLTVDGHLLMMNKAGCLALGVPADSSFGMPWLPLLPEDVHPLGTEALRKAAAGQPARFPGRSISPGGIMYWDNLLTPNLDAEGRVVSILCVSRDITEKTLLERQLDEALDRERLLSQEMHHRIKNVFSLILGLIFIAEKEAAALHDPEAATKLLREKVEALSRASDVVFTQCLDKLHGETGDSLPVDLAKIVSSVLEPYGECCTITGGAVPLRRGSVTTFALFLHELATNSMKYGALSDRNGHVSVCWELRPEGLDLTWSETGGPCISAAPAHNGFGSGMVDRIVRSAGGAVNRSWREQGLLVNLLFPNVICH